MYSRSEFGVFSRLAAYFFQIRKERVRLHGMVEYHNQIKVEVLRTVGGELKQLQLWSKDLVPGDVLIIPPGGAQLPCDAVLISGTTLTTSQSLIAWCSVVAYFKYLELLRGYSKYIFFSAHGRENPHRLHSYSRYLHTERKYADR